MAKNNSWKDKRTYDYIAKKYVLKQNLVPQPKTESKYPPELNYIIYYKTGSNYKVYNSLNNKITLESSILSDAFVNHARYPLIQGYEATEDGLTNYYKDFETWCDELKTDFIFFKRYHNYTEATLLNLKRYLNNETTPLFNIISKERRFNIESQDILIQPVQKDETYFIESCVNSGIIYFDRNILNEDDSVIIDTTSYDFKGYYSHILANTELEIPITEGQYMRLKSIKLPLKFGFYKVIIKSDDNNFMKVFKYNTENLYTHYDVAFALKHKEQFNISITLDTGDISREWNAYLYTELSSYSKNPVIKTSSIFKNWNDRMMLLKIKYPKNRLVKILHTQVWGCLSEVNCKNFKYDELDDMDISLDYTGDWKEHLRYDNDIYKMHNLNDPYRSNLGRLKPFLLSFGRCLMGEIIIPHITSVFRVHTDNICFDSPIVLDIPNLIRESKTSGLIKWETVNTYNRI